MATTFICKVPKENEASQYILYTRWNSTSFHINIIGESAMVAWTGIMSEERAKQTSEQLQLDIKDYIEECKEALTTRSGKRDISYLIEDGCFVWKKLIDSDSGIKVKLGSVVVQPTAFDEVIKNVFNFLIENTNHLEDEVKDLKKQILNLETINCEMLKNIETLTRTKNSMESVLYSCFSDLLNTKKRKIMELESIIQIDNPGTSSEIITTVVSNTEDDCYNAETDSDSAVEENLETERTQQISKRQKGKKMSLNDAMKTESNRTVIAIPSTSSKSRNKGSVASTDKPIAHSSSISHKRMSDTLKKDMDEISTKESNSEGVIQSKKKKNNENIYNDSDATISDDSLLNYPTSVGVIVDSPEVQDNIHNLAIQKKLDKDSNHKQSVPVSNSEQKEQETVATDNVLPESSSLPLKSTDLLDFFYGSDKNVLLPKKV